MCYRNVSERYLAKASQNIPSAPGWQNSSIHVSASRVGNLFFLIPVLLLQLCGFVKAFALQLNSFPLCHSAGQSTPTRMDEEAATALLPIHLRSNLTPIIFTALSMLNRQEHQGGFVNVAINKTAIKLSV